jgi:hypothetical protein
MCVTAEVNANITNATKISERDAHQYTSRIYTELFVLIFSIKGCVKLIGES